MLEFLKRKTPAPQSARLPDLGPGQRVYAIGDIHGRADLFAQLLDAIARDHAGRAPLPLHIILLGDLIDRGPRSAQVIDQAISLSRSDTKVSLLMGNHEEVFLAAARGDVRAAGFFRQIGGMDTLASYGLSDADRATMDDHRVAEWMLGTIPRDHVDFVAGFADHLAIGDYLFVHAGIRPGVALTEQTPADLRWIRKAFLDHAAPFDHMVVHGHSITDAVDERPNRIGIDTGAYYSGRLTAIGLEGTARWYLSTRDGE